MNRYICVAAVSVYVGHAMDDNVAPEQTQEHKQYEQIQKISKAYPPSCSDLKSVQYAAYMEYCAHTFGTGKRGDAGLFFKKLHGSGFGLAPDEQGVTTSAVALASAYLEQRDLKLSNLELYSACDHIMKTKKIPSEWESSHGKRFNGVINGVKKWFTWGSSFVQRGVYKSHCRLTGDSLDADKVSDVRTGIKLSSAPRYGFSLSVQDSVALVFTSAGFSNAKTVFDIFSGTRPSAVERRRLLKKLVKVDKFFESPVARTLMVQEFEANDYDQDLVDIISKTPFFHVLSSTPKFQGKIDQRFRDLPVEKTIVEKWPVSIIVRENEVDVNDEAQARFKTAKPTGKVQKAALAKLSSLFNTIDHRSFNVFEVVQVPVQVTGQTEQPKVTIEFSHTTILMAQHLDAPKSLVGSYDIYSSKFDKPFAFGKEGYYGKYSTGFRPESSFAQALRQPLQASRGQLSALKSKLQEAQDYYKVGKKLRKWSMEIAIIVMAGILTGGWGALVAFCILLFNRLWQIHDKRSIEKYQKEISQKEYDHLLAEVSGRRADGSSRRQAETPAAPLDLMQVGAGFGSGRAGAQLDGVEAHAAAARALSLGDSHAGSGRSQSAEPHVQTTSARVNTNPARASTGEPVLASHADGSDGAVNAQLGQMLDRSRALGGGQGGAAAAMLSSHAAPAVRQRTVQAQQAAETSELARQLVQAQQSKARLEQQLLVAQRSGVEHARSAEVTAQISRLEAQEQELLGRLAAPVRGGR